MISRKLEKVTRYDGETYAFRCDGVGLILELSCHEVAAEAIERALHHAVEAGKKARSAEIARLLGDR